MSIYTGIESGTTFFKMPDVNLLFTAPLTPKRVLIYGLIKQMGINLFIFNYEIDYYEDVLAATEKIEQVQKDEKSGTRQDSWQGTLKGEKLKQFGINKGVSGAVIFYKQVLENKRTSRFGLSIGAVIQVGIAYVGAFFLRQIGDIPSDILFLGIIGVSVYL